MKPDFSRYIPLILLVMARVPSSQGPRPGDIYNDMARHEDPYRNPVILIYGFLGARLADKNTGLV